MQLFEFDSDFNLLPYDGEVYYFGVVLYELKILEKTLLQKIDWQPDNLILYGKNITTKRKTAWFGDNPFPYSYSNSTRIAKPWIPTLLDVKRIIENKTKETFNSCLLNLYHSGAEGMALHSDDEKELGSEPVIASISIGAERKFTFKHKRTKESISITLENGSLLIMKGHTQSYWQHTLPKTTKVNEHRINLTFRTILDKSYTY